MGMDDEALMQAEMQRFLGGSMSGMPGDVEEERAFDQSGKADDAIDYEDIDISDDDLPQEEAPTSGIRDEDDTDFSTLLNQDPTALDGLASVNGHHDAKEQSGDLFGDHDENNDLFGDHSSSPEAERQPAKHPQPQHRPIGLALPKQGTLALPQAGKNYTQPSIPVKRTFSSSSPPLFQDRELSVLSPASSTEDDDPDSLEAIQRRMLRDAGRKARGEDVGTGTFEPDLDLFNSLFATYEESEAPKFIELFPPRLSYYKGKLPIKPPKPVQPTKVSLDLLQDQERSFKSSAVTAKAGQESSYNESFVKIGHGNLTRDESDDDGDISMFDEDERIGNVAMQDLVLICQDWDALSVDSAFADFDSAADDDWGMEESVRPVKKRKTGILDADVPLAIYDTQISFEEPERSVSKVAKAVALDLNDPNLLIDEHAPNTKRKLKRVPGNKRDAALSRDIAKRYNISNDEAYEQLKQNNQNKVRSTIGGVAIEHSFPAVKLQYPFYKVGLDPKAKRAFHRSHLDLRSVQGREFRFQKPKYIKKKNVKGREAKEVFAKADDLSLGDNASMLLLEYSEEAPLMLSNFGMGNRLINYYRKRGSDDTERPKREIGETQVLLQEDKSPFANFGHVSQGETVPTIQNSLYRAPVFSHTARTADFVIGISSTYETGDRLYLRNVENLHVVGQQFPLVEVPGQHSRKVTDAAKKRLRALAYRIWTKSQYRKDKILDNATLMPHLPGHDMPQTRSKMREFMDYQRVGNRQDGTSGVWVPRAGEVVPEAETLRSWVRPEDVCLLDSMQVGVQHLADLGISESKDGDDEKDIDDNSNIEQQLAPWRATKNFINATQGKAMLTLHGEGDPTGRGEGFSFVKTSMKGGFKAMGEAVEATIQAKKRKENNGHSYNVKQQQESYDESIRRIWDAQKNGLGSSEVFSDDEVADDYTEDNSGRAGTPRSSFSTPAAFATRQDDESASQFSAHSAGRGSKPYVIRRSGGQDAYGNPLPDVEEVVTNPRVIKKYKERVMAKQISNIE